MPNVHLVPSDTEIAVNNVFVIGKNYIVDPARRAAQRERPLVISMKPTGAVITPPARIELPEFSGCVHFEIELVLLVGARASKVSEADALGFIAGCGVGLDLTAHDLHQEAQTKGLPWTACKGFDTAAPLSEFIDLQEIKDPQRVDFSLKVNGKTRQSGSSADMIFSFAQMVSGVSHVCTLHPGDVIFTGTPAGAGPLHSGDLLDLDCNGRVKARFEVA